ncbi:MAG: DegQ family serine endoprotease [Dongiaceae bacterium]
MADTKVVPESAEQLKHLSFAPIVKQVAPAVVNIYAHRAVEAQGASPLFDDPFFKHFFGEDFGFGMPRERMQNSLGSGVIVSSDGLVVTNNHVIERSDGITVVLGDRREFEASIVVADERTDLALLRIDPKGVDLPELELTDSDGLEVGDLVLAIGNPFGVGQTVTSGIVSALARTRVGISDLGFFIQTDAAINPGNSGGALVTLDGKLVGINTAIFSKSGGSIGIGFAIPSNMVATVVAAAESGGKLVRPWLGAAGQVLNAELAEGFGLDRPGGIVINEIHPDGPAAAAGLEIGDIVLSVNGHEVLDQAGLRFRTATAKPGAAAKFTIRRGLDMLDLTVVLVTAPETPPRQTTRLAGENPLTGVTVENLSPASAEEMGLDDIWHGVVITKVPRGTYARRIGLAPGDILVKVFDLEIESVDDLQRALLESSSGWRITIRRGDDVQTLVLG